MYKQLERNLLMRKQVQDVIDQHGIKAKYISKKTGLEYTTLSKWRNDKLNYSGYNLDKLEDFIAKYEFKK